MQVKCKCTAVLPLVAFLQHICPASDSTDYYKCSNGDCTFSTYNLPRFKQHVNKHLHDIAISSTVPSSGVHEQGTHDHSFEEPMCKRDHFGFQLLDTSSGIPALASFSDSQFPGLSEQRCSALPNYRNQVPDVTMDVLPPLLGDPADDEKEDETPFFYDAHDHSDLCINGKRYDDSVRHNIHMMYAFFYSRSDLSGKSVQMIYDEFRSFHETYLHGFIRNRILEHYKLLNASESMISELDYMFTSISNVLETMSTHEKRLNVYKALGTLIMPEKQVVGRSEEVKTINSIPTHVPTTCFAQFVPMGIVLTRFLETPGVLKRILDYMETMQTSKNIGVSSYIQGEFWKSKAASHSGKLVLPAALYCDDYDDNNTLGSHGSGHGKQGGFYLNLLSLPPEFQSKLNNIFEFLSFESIHRKLFGNEAIFRRVVEECNRLVQEGITVQTENGPMQIFISIEMIEGDNLGLNELLGFPGSFGNKVHFCRFCTITSDTNTLSTEDLNLLRTQESYDEALRKLQENCSLSESQGVKENSVWNRIFGFHVLLNFCVDIMHDLLEGVCKIVLSNVLYYYTYVTHHLNEETLNDRLAAFAFGPNEKSNVPPDIPPDNIKNKKLRLSSAETLCLFRNLGLLIGDKIPSDSSNWQSYYWKLYTTLASILNLLLRRTIHESTYEYLKTKIEIHIDLFKELVREKLTPKYHFLTHYPRILKLIGPLVNVWSMRNESKNREKKMAARAFISRKNTPYTGSLKSQLKLNYILLGGIVPDSKPTCIEKDTVNLLENADYSYVRSAIPINFDANVKVVKKVLHMGSVYKPGVIIVLFGPDKPFFYLIEDIVESSDKSIHFICKPIEALFDDHFQAYEVTETPDIYFFMPINEVNDVTFMIRQPNGLYYICNKW